MSKKRVLIVDDQSGFTRIIKLTLEKTGLYEVLEKNTSAGVVVAAGEYDPDLILLDVIMPGSDGGDVVGLLKENPRTRDIPVIFLTATVRKQEIDEGGGIIGGYPFLPKPVSAKELLVSVEKHIRQRPG
ncbi:MAG: response regulator [Verrucomicrobia bacterium]|nr:response regulator [Verrucomicrobiota bacterium]MBV9657576.1 response regulator [Verrucomicrobiota bacterium]